MRPATGYVTRLLLAATTCLPATAWAAGPLSVTTNVPGVMARPAAPAGFDPLTASEVALAQYGLPRRPNRLLHAGAYRSWARAMAADRTRLVPLLRLTDVANGPVRDLARQAAVATSSNWSGVVLNSSATTYGANSFTNVATDMIVPSVRQPIGVCSGGYKYASLWAGLDGWSSPDVLQAGIEADAYCNATLASQRYYAWYEWYPANQVEITNLSITPGDTLYISVAALTSTLGSFYVVNESTGQSASLNFSAPAGTSLQGSSIEWISERPTVRNSVSTLADYTAVYYSFAYGFTASATFASAGYVPTGDGELSLTMLDSNNLAESQTFILGAYALGTNTTGSAY